jgi:hypothetical protein
LRRAVDRLPHQRRRLQQRGRAFGGAAEHDGALQQDSTKPASAAASSSAAPKAAKARAKRFQPRTYQMV